MKQRPEPPQPLPLAPEPPAAPRIANEIAYIVRREKEAPGGYALFRLEIPGDWVEEGTSITRHEPLWAVLARLSGAVEDGIR